MKRALSLIIALTVLLACAPCCLAQGEPITGRLCFPLGADESTARCVLSYRLPPPPDAYGADAQIAALLTQGQNALLADLAAALTERAEQALPGEAQVQADLAVDQVDEAQERVRLVPVADLKVLGLAAARCEQQQRSSRVRQLTTGTGDDDVGSAGAGGPDDSRHGSQGTLERF